MLKIVRHSFKFITNDVRQVNLKKSDKQMLKAMGLHRLPAHLTGVEFSYIGKFYQGIGMKNDLGGVEFFHHEHAPETVTLRAAAPITCHHPKNKHSHTCCLFYDFMDYLAYCSLKGNSHFHLPQNATCIIMSHVGNFMHMVVDSDDYDEVFLYFPNTLVGKTISMTLKQRNQHRVKNCDILYKGYRSLREFVMELCKTASA